MPRPRRTKAKTEPADVSDSSETGTDTPVVSTDNNNSSNNATQNKERTKMAALDMTTIQALLSNQKSRGDYDAELAAFLSEGEAGIEVSLTEGRFAGRSAAKVKTGLDNARKRTNEAGALVHTGAQNVKVVAVGGKEGEEQHVYLIDTSKVGGGDDA